MLIRKRDEQEREEAKAKRTIAMAKENLRKRLPPTYESSVSRTIREERELLEDIAVIEGTSKKHRLGDLIRRERPMYHPLPCGHCFCRTPCDRLQAQMQSRFVQ
jgi:hypothetical protein